ncbi:actin-like protein 7B [Scyliorhinus canicula]|uniref:actin-like protein 7B n=1 Tax=Scyliorhinus canicula TaxID=7830 RepID=UPI0018F6DB6C|nr:actin-like protein 7B [Scyliorhinus canicula]
MKSSNLHIRKCSLPIGVLCRKYPSNTTQSVRSEPRMSSFSSIDSHSIHPARMIKEIRALMIDMGTGYFKAGFGGQAKPSVVISSTVGRPMQRSAKTGDNRQENFVGSELRAPFELRLINPLRHGIVLDWTGAEALLCYIFDKELKVRPEDHAVMVADPPLSPVTNRERTAELLFEAFGIPAIHITRQSLLSIYAYGCTSGLVVESGFGSSCVVPIHEGYIMPHITATVDYGGSDLTKYLLKLINHNGYKIGASEYHLVEKIKQEYCYTAIDFDNEMRSETKEYTAHYELPDGKIITVGKERIKCPEALFNPSLMGSREAGLHTMALNIINKCDPSLLEEMYKNILLCGGSTMFSGFRVRFQKELRKLVQDMNPQVQAIPERKYSVWYGGSILSCLKSFQQLWVSKKDYDERGPLAIYRKCF